MDKAPANAGTDAVFFVDAQCVQRRDLHPERLAKSGSRGFRPQGCGWQNPRAFRLSRHQGHRDDLFRHWCEPCKKEMGHLDDIYQARKGDDVIIIAISMDEPETQGEVRPYVKQRGISFPVLLDIEGRATDQFDPKGDAPFNLILDRKGDIAWSKLGYMPGDEKVLEKALVSVLEQSPGDR